MEMKGGRNGRSSENVQQKIIALSNTKEVLRLLRTKLEQPKQAVYNWMKGSNAPDIERIAKIASVYNLRLSDFLNPDHDSHIDSRRENWIEIPFYGSIAAGTPIEMINAEDTYLVPSKIVNEHPGHRLGVLQIKGNSFNAGGIYDGFFVVVDFDENDPRTIAIPTL